MRPVAALALALAVAGLPAVAQIRPPRAEVTAVVYTLPVEAGRSVRLVLDVRLPEDIHVQSDQPRDRLLIPTVLNVRVPEGLTVDRIVYPAATDLVQSGRSEPLAVFGGHFTIEAHLSVALGVPAGDVTLPAQLRYQACDDTVCYAPARADVEWTLRVTSPPAPHGVAGDAT